MDRNRELIVPFKLTHYYVPFFCGLISVGLSYLMFLQILFYYPLNDYSYSILNYSALLASVLSLCGILYRLYLIRNGGPAAILNDHGIYVKNFGFIPWNTIQAVDNYWTYHASDMETYWIYRESIAVRVYDLKALSKQSTFLGKVSIFCSRIFGTPPILISNIDMQNEPIIDFSRRFIPES